MDRKTLMYIKKRRLLPALSVQGQRHKRPRLLPPARTSNVQQQPLPVQRSLQEKNFYHNVEKEFQKKRVEYAEHDAMQIDLPAMAVVVGGTGSGKTNTAINFVEHVNAFDRFFIFTANKEEPLYASLTHKLREVEKATNTKILTIHDDFTTVPTLKSLEDEMKDKQSIVIFDDCILADRKAKKNMEEYFMRARKANATCMLLSQSYYDIPIFIRKNAQYFFFKGGLKANDLKRILTEHNTMGVDADTLIRIYNDVTGSDDKDDMTPFLLVDTLANTPPDLRLRRNYQGIPAASYLPPDKLGPQQRIVAAPPPAAPQPRHRVQSVKADRERGSLDYDRELYDFRPVKHRNKDLIRDDDYEY